MPALLAEATDGTRPALGAVPDDAISVLIVAKDPISHAGVERQLLALADFTVLTPASGCHPDIALVVADSVDDGVLRWIRTIRKHSLSRIVVVAAVTAEAAQRAIRAGANGVIDRGLTDGPRLAWAIQKVHRGDSLALAGTAGAEPHQSPACHARVDDTTVSVTGVSGAGVSGAGVSGAGVSGAGVSGAGVGAATAVRKDFLISERDRAVLRLLAEGCDTGEIARALAYSEPTIKNVIQRLFEQFKAKNRPHVVALALRSGII